MKRNLSRAGAAALLVTAIACGSRTDTPRASGLDTATPTPGAGAELVLRIATGGGFVPPQYTLSQFPELSVYSDGRVIAAGPQIEIFPPPLLPSLTESRISDGDVQKLRDLATQAGLNQGDASYGYAGIADAPTTTFTYIDNNGTTSEVSAYALSFQETAPPADFGDTEYNPEARKKLAQFQKDATEITSGDETEQWDYTNSRLFLLEVNDEEFDPDLDRQEKDWPLSTPMSEFGKISDTTFYASCGVLTGADLEAFIGAAAGANELTLWVDGSLKYQAVLRPLLPDEEAACPS